MYIVRRANKVIVLVELVLVLVLALELELVLVLGLELVLVLVLGLETARFTRKNTVNVVRCRAFYT